MLRKVPDVLIGTPGRLIEHLNAGSLILKDVEILVIDEADRMLDMGFAEDMQRTVGECQKRQQTLLFSATSGAPGCARWSPRCCAIRCTCSSTGSAN